MKKKQPDQTSRRDFLKGAAAGGVAAAAVTGAGSVVADSLDEPVVEQADANGYQVTDHVRTYYQKARF